MATRMNQTPKTNREKENKYYNSKNFNVLFYGNWQRLHGLDVVSKAIVLLKQFNQIFFSMIGNYDAAGLRKKAEKYLQIHNAKNYRFLDNVSLKELADFIRSCDLVLAGGFSDDEKAKIVIRNSTYESMACGAFMIVPDTPANNEILKDNYSCFMCKIGNPKSLAQRILDAKGNQEKIV